MPSFEPSSSSFERVQKVPEKLTTSRLNKIHNYYQIDKKSTISVIPIWLK